MRLIAFITDFRQISRILEHIGEQTLRRPISGSPKEWSRDDRNLLSDR
jgi:hypothetical protein